MNIVKFDVNLKSFVAELEAALGKAVYDQNLSDDSEINLTIYDDDDDFNGRMLSLDISGRWLHAKISVPPHLNRQAVEKAYFDLESDKDNGWSTDLWFTRTLGPLDNIENEEQLAALVADALKEN